VRARCPKFLALLRAEIRQLRSDDSSPGSRDGQKLGTRLSGRARKRDLGWYARCQRVRCAATRARTWARGLAHAREKKAICTRSEFETDVTRVSRKTRGIGAHAHSAISMFALSQSS